MGVTSKETIKSILRKLGLYKPAVSVYCWFESLYLKGQNTIEYLWSLFLNARFMMRKDSEGLPFPPARLVYLVTNTYRYAWFYDSGIIGAQCIRDILEKNNYKINEFTSILDFGCGCGRMMRHWKTLRGPNLYGSDYNPVLVEWCRKNLSFAGFAVNGPASRLIYEDQ